MTITVELSESAYCYLIEFNFEGDEQLIWPADAKSQCSPSAQPTKQSRIHFPTDPNRIFLEEAKEGSGKERSGLQVYVVAAARKPLPCYAQWKKQRGEVSWTRRPPGDTVWLADQDRSFAVLPGRVERSRVRPAGKGPSLDELCRSMQSGGVETVKALAFPVLPEENER